MNQSIGFIGGGRITAIFLMAWKAAGIDLDRIVVSDAAPDDLEGLRSVHPGIKTTPDNTHSREQGIVVLAQHPPAMKIVLPEAGPPLQVASTFVSLAPAMNFAAMLHGAVAQLLESWHSFEAVMDTIPGKPLSDSQTAIQAPFRDRLSVLHARLTGQWKSVLNPFHAHVLYPPAHSLRLSG